MKSFVLTPATGKRLIAKAMARHPAVRERLERGRLVIVAGTTNGYVAEEVLHAIGQGQGFGRRRFFRGITMPPGRGTTDTGRLPDESAFPGDVVITDGTWEPGRTIFDVIDGLAEGDIILKGANALDLARRRAAILIGHPKAGTVGAALQAVAGRRVRLILPVGLEKRVPGCLDALAAMANAPGVSGPRLLPVLGEPFTELDAIALLSGAAAEVIAAGGVRGAEGAVWIGVRGAAEQVAEAESILESVQHEPPFQP